MERLNQKNIKANKDIYKLKLKVQSIKFVGHIVTDIGIAADREEISAITSMSRQSDKTGLLRFMGMPIKLPILFLPKLEQNYSPTDHAHIGGAEFCWSEAQEKSFLTAKELISKIQFSCTIT